jgi:low affinity Fe/Cu permease
MITTITGVNDFMRSSKIDELVSQFLASNEEIGLERLDGEEASGST